MQHAYNPVDWYPWGEEAFEKAEAEDKPIFLSIGYSTCHWCHVMEHESFEDPEVAKILNDGYIPVKVDREEQPDIDAVYMAVCQAMTGGGGWPLTIVMTPEKKPFYAGTYLPKHRKYGHMGLTSLLRIVAEQWKNDKEALVGSGERISEAVAGWRAPVQANAPGADRELVRTALSSFAESFDPRFGGFGAAPKFPMPHNLMFLLRCYAFEKDAHALQMVETTLRQMYKGGIFDHIGFGFSRYSTDEKWLAPHFEKMLYDNALMVIALAECFQVTGNPLYREIAEKTLLYISREMTSPEGGFYSAQDADSDGVEGKYYTFTPKEVIGVLGREAGAGFFKKFDISERGNFGGVSIPNLPGSDDTLSEDPAVLSKLYDYRLGRTSLHKDDKFLTAWNALMIAACAKAYRAFGESGYLQMAERAFQFVGENLNGETGLKISFREGKTGGKGLLDDHAFLTWASLELYESSFDIKYLSHAVELAETVLDQFSDPDGGFYMTPESGEPLIFRPKELHDGAMPSGNSVFALCLTRLAALTGTQRWAGEADRQISFLLPVLSGQPQGHAFALTALTKAVYPAQELVCVLRNEDTAALAAKLGKVFRPNLSIIVKTPCNDARLSELAPFTKNYAIPDKEQAAFYLCQKQSCSAPVYDMQHLLEKLDTSAAGS